jgi:hypothetical protein
LTAASTSLALRSGSLRSAIVRICSAVSVPTVWVSGFDAPDWIPSALRMRKLVGGVL